MEPDERSSLAAQTPEARPRPLAHARLAFVLGGAACAVAFALAGYKRARVARDDVRQPRPRSSFDSATPVADYAAGDDAPIADDAPGDDDDGTAWMSYSYGDIVDTWEWISSLSIAQSDSAVVCPQADFALCNIGMCTLNDDKLTASCGCQSMSASEENPANVGLDAAGILAPSKAYRDLVKACSEMDNTTSCSGLDATTLCDEIANGTLYPASMAVDYVSFYAMNPLYAATYGATNQTLADDMGTIICEGDVMCAVCQGAPCYAKAYDAPVYDLTCICPVTENNCSLKLLESNGDMDACTEILADDAPDGRACAASSTVDSTALFPDARALADTIAAVVAAKADGDSSQCPTLAKKLPSYTGEHGTDDDTPYFHDDT